MYACQRQSTWLLSILLTATLGARATAAEQWWPPITDPPTGTHQPGRFVWAELLTRDVGRAGEFYAAGLRLDVRNVRPGGRFQDVYDRVIGRRFRSPG